MSNGIVRVAPDNAAGKAVDTTEIVRPDGTVVQRQRVAIGGADPDSVANVAETETTGTEPALVVREADVTVRDLLLLQTELLQAIINRLPMPDAALRARVLIESSSTAGRFPMMFPMDGGSGAMFPSLMPFNQTAAGAAFLYQQITVS